MLHFKNKSIETIRGEVWKDIVGFEGLYQASSLGRIKSVKKYVNCKGKSLRVVRERVLAQTLNNQYLKVSLGRGTSFSVHILVAKAHIKNHENKPTVNHKKGFKLDNRVSELEWATESEQMLHAYKFGLILNHGGFKKNELHPSSIPIVCINNSKTYSCSKEAARELKLHSSHIREVCAEIRKTTGGYIFKYA